MAHGDLIPGNVLVAEGRLVGVIDVGGLGPADPALDLVATWHFLEANPRRTLREALLSDDLGWVRGAAWAFQQARGGLVLRRQQPADESDGPVHPRANPGGRVTRDYARDTHAYAGSVL